MKADTSLATCPTATCCDNKTRHTGTVEVPRPPPVCYVTTHEISRIVCNYIVNFNQHTGNSNIFQKW